MREILAPEQEAAQQRRGSSYQQDSSGSAIVDPSAPYPSQPSPPPLPPPPAQQLQPPSPPQQQQPQPQQPGEQQQPHASQPAGVPGPLPPPPSPPPPQQHGAGENLGGGASAGTAGEEPSAGAPGRPQGHPIDPGQQQQPQYSQPHPQQQQQQQQQQHRQKEDVAATASGSEATSQLPNPNLHPAHPPHHSLPPNLQPLSTASTAPPQQPSGTQLLPPQQQQQQQLLPPTPPQLQPPQPPHFGSPPQLQLALQAPLQLHGLPVPPGGSLGLSLFGHAVQPAPAGPQDMPYEPLGMAPPQHPHPQPHMLSTPSPTPQSQQQPQQAPLSQPSQSQSPMLHSPPSPRPQRSSPPPQQQQQSAPSAAPSPPPQPQLHPQPQQLPIQPQLQQPQQQSLQPQLQQQQQQHIVWDELRQRDAQILVLQKKLGHFRSWLAGVHAKVQASNPSAINNYKRLYVGNLPPNTTEEELKHFLHSLMVRTGANAAPGNAILSCKLKAAPAPGAPPGAAGPVPPPGPGPPDKHYAFIELRSVEEASNAMAFDGVAFKNAYLKVRRPSNYDTATAVMLGPTTPDPTIDLSQLEICRTVVENSPHKLFVGGLPCEWGEDMVKELLVPFGTLKSFNLVMDKSTGKSKGYAFCEYVEDSSADLLIKNLHMRRIGSKALTVKRAMEGSRTGGGGGGGGSSGGTGAGGGSGSGAGPSQPQQLLSGSPPAMPPLTPANMAVMSRVASAAAPGGPGGGSAGGGPGGAAAAAAAAMAAAALGGVGPEAGTSQSLRGGWGADGGSLTEALNVLLQQHSASRNLFAAAAAAAAANPAAPQTPSAVPGLAVAAAALQQFHNRGGADLSNVGSGAGGSSELTQGVRPMGQHHHGGHHPQHPGHHHHQHPHHPQHPSQHQQQQEAAAAAAEAAAQQLAAAAGVGAFDLSSLTGPGMGFW